MADEIERQSEDGWPVIGFEDAAALERWLDAHCEDSTGFWLKFAKKGRGIPSITLNEALEVMLCFGWIDSKLHRLDDDYYVLRYQPRRPSSAWSARNKALAKDLIANGRMRPSGLAAIEAAIADGRWSGA